jgi:aspartyl-tRNA(Asn)/glutamyl-tRNA(Gln) amidotransferase subunit B
VARIRLNNSGLPEMTIVEARTPDPKKFIKGATGDWEVVIGMEVHAQVTSASKLFSGASTEFGKEPNSNVSLVDAAMPGMLPVINEECVAQAIRTGLGLKAQINLKSVFDRKNYFYPDLPQGYQISQFKQPIVGEGKIVLDVPDEQALSASSACIWSRTRASRCTTSIRPCPSSTSTVRASR